MLPLGVSNYDPEAVWMELYQGVKEMASAYSLKWAGKNGAYVAVYCIESASSGRYGHHETDEVCRIKTL
jgi:hypothetical protein